MTSLTEQELMRLKLKLFQICSIMIDALVWVSEESVLEDLQLISAHYHFPLSVGRSIQDFQTALVKQLQVDFSSITDVAAFSHDMERLHAKIRDEIARKCLILIERKSQITKAIFSPLHYAAYESILRYISSGSYVEGLKSEYHHDVVVMKECVDTHFSSYVKPAKDPFQITLVRKLIELLNLFDKSKLSRT